MPTTYDSIATTTLGSASNSVTFSSIPQTYTDLRLIWRITSSSVGTDTLVRFNGNSSADKYITYIGGTGSSNTIGNLNAQTSFYTSLFDSTSQTQPVFLTLDIMNYRTTHYKSFLATALFDKNGSGGPCLTVGTWPQSSAIDSITCFLDAGATMAAGTTLTLYGILKA